MRVRAGAVPGGFRGKQQDDLRHLGRLAEPARRGAPDGGCLDRRRIDTLFLDEGLGHSPGPGPQRGLDRAGTDRVHPDDRRAQLARLGRRVRVEACGRRGRRRVLAEQLLYERQGVVTGLSYVSTAAGRGGSREATLRRTGFLPTPGSPTRPMTTPPACAPSNRSNRSCSSSSRPTRPGAGVLTGGNIPAGDHAVQITPGRRLRSRRRSGRCRSRRARVRRTAPGRPEK